MFFIFNSIKFINIFDYIQFIIISKFFGHYYKYIYIIFINFSGYIYLINLYKLIMTSEFKYYPNISDEDFQNSIYEKREYYSNRMESIDINLDSYDNIKKYRDNICIGELKLYSHQSFLSNYINPYTPYKGLLILSGVGTGKTGSAISIADNFKEMVLKYGNKIHILVPGPLIKIIGKVKLLNLVIKIIMKIL